MKRFSWQCPYCQYHAIVTHSNLTENAVICDKSGVSFHTIIITCPNEACNEYIINSTLQTAVLNTVTHRWQLGETLETWQLKPQSSAKVLPAYIPQAIVNDYHEACLIKNLSPKASATLSRRCLQGMIRDFFKIQRKTLLKEILAIQDKIDASTYKAIDAVRKLGNIGAHMERNIDLIIDIEPNEADILIELIETLLDEWYINRHKREERNNKIFDLSYQKSIKKRKEVKTLEVAALPNG